MDLMRGEEDLNQELGSANRWWGGMNIIDIFLGKMDWIYD